MTQTPLGNDLLYELVKRIQRDDPQSGLAFELLLHQMRSWQLFSFTNSTEAEELFQELTYRLWVTKLGSFDGDRGHFVKAYINRAAVNLYHEFRRNPREGRRRTVDNEVWQDLLATDSDESAQLVFFELRQAVQDYFNTLDARTRTVIEMTIVNDASRVEIVAKTGLTLLQVTAIRQRCLAELRERLERQGYHIPPKRAYHRKNEGVG